MAYFNTCPHCGSNLDPGERCECVRERTLHVLEMGRVLETDESGQITFNFEGVKIKKAI